MSWWYSGGGGSMNLKIRGVLGETMNSKRGVGVDWSTSRFSFRLGGLVFLWAWGTGSDQG